MRTYEPNRNLLTDIDNRAGTNLISHFAYENDASGRRTTRIDTHPFVVPPSGGSSTNTFGYNIRSEVVAALIGGNDYGYKYDPIGNREQASLNAVTNFYAANALNQYTNISNGTVVEPTYDDDGNMLTYNGWTFTWNGENRLISASNATTVVENAYDYMGRRIQKVLNGVTNTFVYDGWAMIREQSPTVTNSYVYGIDLSGSMQGAGTIGGLLSMSSVSSLQSSVSYYAYDANGNVTDLVNTNGATVAHYEYDAFGQTTVKSGTLADANPFRFSTKYLDEEPNLYYYGYRYYSPELGRWPSRDPLAEQGSRIGFTKLLSAHRGLIHLGDIKSLSLMVYSPEFGYNSATLDEPLVNHIFTEKDFIRSVKYLFQPGLSFTPISVEIKGGFEIHFTPQQRSDFKHGGRWDDQFVSDATQVDLYVFLRNSIPDKLDIFGLNMWKPCYIFGCVCPDMTGGTGCNTDSVASESECDGRCTSTTGMSWPCVWAQYLDIGVPVP